MNVVRHYVHRIRPHHDAVIAAVGAHARFDEINLRVLI